MPEWSAPEPGFARWVDGARLASSRALEPEERWELWARLGRLLLIGTVAWILAAATFLFSLGFGAAWAARSLGEWSVLIAGMTVGTAATVLLALSAHRAHRKARRLSRGARVGVIEIYRREAAEDEPEASTQLEVLSGAGTAWAEDGQRVPGWRDAWSVDLACQPDSAHIAAQWLEPVREFPREGVFQGSRELSGAERLELLRHRRGMVVRPAFTLGLLAVWALSHAVRLWATGWRGAGSLVDILLLVLGLKWMADLVSCLRLGLSVQRDRQEGRVFILKDEGVAESPEGGVRLEEYLPDSRLLWTSDRAPAAWRFWGR